MAAATPGRSCNFCLKAAEAHGCYNTCVILLAERRCRHIHNADRGMYST